MLHGIWASQSEPFTGKSNSLALKNKGFWFALALLLNSCGIYSFTGASVSPDTKTIAILNFDDRSASGPTFLAQAFTEKSREYFQRNSSLSLVNREGDLSLEGSIMQYNLSPVAPVGAQGVERAAQTRLTIAVKVKFTNQKNSTQNFEQVFSFFQDFDQTKSFASVERDLIETISDQLILDIFNKSLASW